ncbi:MAG: pantoate--beta-alanine ligase, partial [Bryobacteraceae bacterium]
PTMGALHAGHGSLIETARRETGCVAVSIFVNPIQFNQQEDYIRYPRPLAVDAEFCRARGADIVFAPAVEEMYPSPQRTFVEVAGVSARLCGEYRPGHFRGVATVVSKLFHIVQPHRAYFGEKDAQQLAVIRRMAKDLNVPVEIVAVPTVREESGLALSSRNRLLTPEQRAIAPALYQALRAAAEMVSGGLRDIESIKTLALEPLAWHPEIRVEYFEIVDPDEMQPVEQIAGPVVIAAAVWLGSTRLIDNVQARPA